MQESLLEFARSIMGSPWIYLIVFGIACLDSFIPLVPSETLMITGGVFAATDGQPQLLLLIAAGAAGAFVGDHIAYSFGRLAREPVTRWAHRGPRRQESLEWATRNIDKRGGLILIVARYIPAGRTITTLTMGVVRFPLAKFSFFDMLAALSWATYGAMIGYLGGHAFEDNPLYGLLLGFGVAFAITIIVEIVRKVIKSRRAGVAAES